MNLPVTRPNLAMALTLTMGLFCGGRSVAQAADLSPAAETQASDKLDAEQHSRLLQGMEID